jgi:signal transduction histidine kinase
MLRESREASGTQLMELELMDGINSGTRRLKDIIDDMIDVSMIDNNLLKLNFQPVWIDRILQILKVELETAARERRQRVFIEDFPGASEMTFGDPERLMQVFRNVLSNAIKFTPDGGSVTVSGRKLSGFIEVVVNDTGIGINPEDQAIVFDKFTRLGNISLHSSGKTKFKGGGPGLGLHIARGIIESHGGAIWVESPGYDEENMPGSTFHIMVPQRSEPPDTSMAKLFSPLHTHNPLEEKVS